MPHPVAGIHDNRNNLLRRLELEQRDELEQARPVLQAYPFIGFSTYGEPLGGLHMNQTLTGVALGSAS